MTTKTLVRAVLEDNVGRFISGESLARRLHVSRNAVWRAVKSLQEEGCAITAVTNRGYMCLREGRTAPEPGCCR